MAAIIFVVLVALSIALYDYFDSREWQHVTSVQRNNVVFEERNKKYGAYSIRRDYNDLIMLILFCILAAVGIFKIVNSAFIDKTAVTAIVPEYDTVAITLEAPPLQDIETVPTPYKIAGGGGSGTASNAKYDPTPNPMMKEQSTVDKSTEHVIAGKGNQTNSTNKTNTATTTNYDPFANGTGGKGGGEHGGKGTGVGDDDGSGHGNGPTGTGGGTSVRKLIRKPNTLNIKSDDDCRIVLNVTVNADGDVINATVDNAGTTTSNSALIREVIALVKRDAKYSPSPGARNVTLRMPPLLIKPH